MQTSKSKVAREFGYQLVDSISISEDDQNLLFATLILSSVGVLISGNLLLLNGPVLLNSARIALACLALLLIFYMLSRATGSVTWGLVLVYGLMWLLVYSRQAWFVPIVHVLALVALGYAARFLRVQRSQWIYVLLMAVLATAVSIGVTRAYTSFDMLNRLHTGNVQQDTLFHASIAAMIKNYGVSSTGLHGLVETPYHVLSHVLFASVSLLSGTGVFEVYGVANWVLFAPLLIFSAVACCVMLDRPNQLNMPVTWGIVCVSLVFSPFLLQHWGLFESFFVSESYLVSLGLFLLGLPLLFKRQLSSLDLFLIMILTAQIASAKSSVGLIFAGLWLARLIFVRGERVRFDLAALAISFSVVAWMVIDSAEANTGTMNIVPLHFISENSFLGEHLIEAIQALQTGKGLSIPAALLALVAVLSFFAFHFLLSWVVIARVAYKDGVLSVFSNPLSIYALAAIFAGTVVILLFEIPNGSAQYFSNVALFVALPGVVALFALAFSRLRVPTHLLLASGILVISLLNVKGFYRASAFHSSRSTLQHNALIDSLIEVRDSKPVNLALQLDEEAIVNNPMSRCTAQPFVYPAISERPWIDVICSQNNCPYENYGFSQYGFTDLEHTITVQPQLIPEMKVLRWSQATTGTK